MICKKLYDKYFYTPYINSMLSNPVTHLANIAGNSVMSLMMPTTKFMAGGAALIRGDFKQVAKHAQEAKEMVVGQAEGLLDFIALKRPAITKSQRRAAFNRREAIYEQYPMTELSATSKFGGEDAAYSRSLVGAYERDPIEATVHMLGKYVIQGPTTALNNMDTMFKMIAYRGQLHSKAYTQGFAAGGSRAARAANMHKFLNNPDQQYMVQGAIDKAKWATYTNDLHGAAQWIAKFSDVPFLNLYVPFLKTPTNIMLTNLEHTPAAIFLPRFWADIRSGGAARDMAFSKIGTGFGLGMAMTYILGDNITGSRAKPGTAEFEMQKVSGRPPNSVKIFDTWYSLDKIEFLSLMAKPISLYHDIRRYSDMTDASQAENVDNYVTALALGYANIIFEEGMFDSFANLMNGLSTVNRAIGTRQSDLTSLDPERRRLAEHKFWSQVGGVVTKPGQAVLPRIVDYFNVNLEEELGGNKYRRVKSQMNVLEEYADSLKARIPSLSNKMAVERNAFGDPVAVPYGLTLRGMNPGFVYEGSPLVNPAHVPIAQEIAKYRVELPHHSMTVSGMIISPEEKSGIQLRTGELFVKYMQGSMRSIGYQSMTPSQKNAHIKMMYKQARREGIRYYGGVDNSKFAVRLALQEQINILENTGRDASQLIARQDSFR